MLPSTSIIMSSVQAQVAASPHLLAPTVGEIQSVYQAIPAGTYNL